MDIKGCYGLIVDDYPFNVQVAVKFLTKWGIEVDVAEKGLVGLEKCWMNQYALMLMGLPMPVMELASLRMS